MLGAPRGWPPPTCSRGLQGLRQDAWPRFAVPQQTSGERHAKLSATHLAREPQRAIHARTRGGRGMGALELPRRIAKRRSRPLQKQLEQATLAAEDHDASERRHHHRYAEENPNRHDLCPARVPDRIVTLAEAFPRATSCLLDGRGRAIVRPVPASRPRRVLGRGGWRRRHWCGRRSPARVGLVNDRFQRHGASAPDGCRHPTINPNRIHRCSALLHILADHAAACRHFNDTLSSRNLPPHRLWRGRE